MRRLADLWKWSELALLQISLKNWEKVRCAGLAWTNLYPWRWSGAQTGTRENLGTCYWWPAHLENQAPPPSAASARCAPVQGSSPLPFRLRFKFLWRLPPPNTSPRVWKEPHTAESP